MTKMIILLLGSYFFGGSVKMPWQAWTLVAIVGILWFWRKQKTTKRSNGLKEIPGPRGLPLLGNLLQLGRFPYKQYCKWADQYGGIYKVNIGVNTSIIISDPKLCKEIFSTDPALTGRPQFSQFSLYEDEPNLGIFTSEGERWEVHRRFLLRQLRDFGFGKSSMETLIMEELKEVLKMFEKRCGEPVSGIRETLRLAVVNSLWMLMSSQRFDHDDPKLLRLTDNTSKAFDEAIVKGSALIFLPWIRHLIPELSGYRNIRKILEENKLTFETSLQQHKRNFQEDDLKDFIDVYLAEMKKAEHDTKSLFYGSTAERQLVVTLFHMFIAGTDSTAITTAWGIFYLCKFPHIQRKFQAEIAEVTGGNCRTVSVNDRPDMPYTLALIDEILRFSTIAPDGVPHRALTNTQFQGYFIAKDTFVQPNLYYIHHNPKIWVDPENFRPERFLSEDGKKYVKSENLQAFQIGRRQCVGETLARDTVFLYLTNIFQKFDIKFNPNIPEPGLESDVGFFRSPFPHSVIMKERLG